MSISSALIVGTYVILVALWTAILAIYVYHLKHRRSLDSATVMLLIILAIDAFRTLFESSYFGLSVSSGFGLVPKEIGEVLSQPQLTLIPKAINILAALLILFLLLRHWLPHEIKNKAKTLSALRESEARFRSIFENSPVGMALAHTNATLEKVNPAFQQMIGYSEEEIKKLGWRPLTHPADVQGNMALVQDVVNGKSDFYHMDKRYIHKNGSIVWVSVTTSALRDENGACRYLVTVIEDITERKNVEASLRKLQRAVDQSPVVVVITDRLGNIEYVNPAFTEVTGYTSQEAIGQNPKILNSGHHTPEFYQELWETILAGQVWRSEFFNCGKDGVFFWEEASISPVLDDRGEITHFVAVKQDITARKQAETELRQAREDALRANAAKSEFLANMSHEIRTPMNTIVGLSHLLQLGSLEAKQRDHVGKIQSAGHSLLGIIDDILDFSKIEAGRLDLEQIPFSLDETLAKLADLTVVKATAQKIGYLFDVPADIPDSLIGDPLRLHQVLLNLCDNAIKFTSAGEVVLQIRKIDTLPEADEASSDPVRLRFTISDTGVGLSQRQISHLFRAFHQADGSTTRRYGGTGLGLIISQRLAGMMGGQIRIDSQIGQGSRFFFELVFEHAGTTDFDPVLPADLQGRRALILVEQDGTREMMTGLLRSMGLESEVRFGTAWMETADPSAWDLWLVDPTLSESFLKSLKTWAASDVAALSAVLWIVPVNHKAPLPSLHPEVEREGSIPLRFTRRALRQTLLQLFGHASAVEEPALPLQAVDPATLAHLRGARVLLVEDHKVNQEVAQEILATAGLHVDLVENGRQAVDIVRDHGARYAAVLMDLQMPVMDGYVATRTIRSENRWPQLPIIAMTANVIVGERRRCLDAGMNDYLPKPIDVRQLFAILVRWIPADGPRENLPPPDPTPPPNFSERVPEDLPGVDVATGLNRFLGRQDAYLRVLWSFRESAAGVLEELQAAVKAGNRADVHRLAHGLKGMAGNIQANALARCAADLEQKTSDGPSLSTPAPTSVPTSSAPMAETDLTAALQSIETHLADLLRGLERLGAFPPPSQPSMETTPAPEMADGFGVAEEIREIRRLLRTNNLSARKAWEDLAARLARHQWTGTGLDEALAEGRRALDTLRFPEAAGFLDQIESRLPTLPETNQRPEEPQG